MALACPAVRLPSSISSMTRGGSFRSLSELATVLLSFPSIPATSLTETPKRSRSAAYPRASSIGFRSSLWRFSRSANFSESSSVISLTIAGTVFLPAFFEALRRLSPRTS